jgi:hypothetical protein
MSAGALVSSEMMMASKAPIKSSICGQDQMVAPLIMPAKSGNHAGMATG